MPWYARVAEACEAGYAAGRSRRTATAEERERFRTRKLWGAFRRGVRRGMSARARLDQLELEVSG